jgi:regulator of sirC expression with transglutaminase-like and TPR domain
MRPKEFAALVALLEDPDPQVYGSISSKLIAEGLSLIPLLENSWGNSTNSLLQTRIEDIIHQIQFQNTKRLLSSWVDNGSADLLRGALYVANYQYPDIEYDVIENNINKIKQKVWLELNKSLTPLEKVKVLNHVFYGVFGFSGNTANFFAPSNHFINQLIETKKGGPVLISIFYALVAQHLGLPIFPVSLPRNFLVAYKDRYYSKETSGPEGQSILFYINPFNQGSVIGRKEIGNFLSQNNITPKEEYFNPCSNRMAIVQLIGSLIVSYQKTGNVSKVNDLRVFMDLLVE